MSSGPQFLTLDIVRDLHEESLARFGGSAGVRDPGLVESALASAQNAWWYGQGDLFDVAAAYAFHLAEAQAFLDGNKRTGAAAALVFLSANGCGVVPDDGRIYRALIDVANKRITKPDLAEILRRLYCPRPDRH